MNPISNRLDKLGKKMKEIGAEAVLITKKENYTYFSGFNGTSASLLIIPSRRFLFTDARYLSQAAEQAPDYEIVNHKNKLTEHLKDTIKGLRVGTLGMEDKALSYDIYTKYEKEEVAPRILRMGNTLDHIRAVKDTDEMSRIKDAVRIADESFTHVLKFIKPGVREVEIAAEIEYYLKKNGAKGPSFDTIVASGKRSSLPHGVASTKRIEAGDVVVLDFGAIFNDYCSDMTRTVFVGNPNEEMRKIYTIVKEAQERALNALSTGITGVMADAIAREFIASHGYGENFGHGLGHGVGLEIHEAPTLSPRSENNLEKGMVVTVEPGIYILGLGGVRIEDMAILTDHKPEILTKSSKEMIVL